MKGRCIAFAFGAIIVCVLFFQQNATVIIDWINTLGLMAPVFFLILYCVATLLFFPTMILTLAGGAIFGPIVGTIINLLGATLGAACAFCISRYLLSGWFQANKGARFNKLIAGVESRGWQFVALLRIVPIIPFNIVNYGLGLTRIKFSHYLITTLIFLFPMEIISTYFGYASMDILTSSQTLRSSSLFFLLIFGLCIILFKWVSRKRPITNECQ